MIADTALSLVAYALSWAIGFLALKIWLRGLRNNALLTFFLSPGVGFGLSVLILFAAMCESSHFSRLFLWAAHVFLFLSLLGWHFLRFKGKEERIKDSHARRWLWAALMGVATLLFFAQALKSPYGTGLDVWAIWKLKARFLYYDTASWQKIFSKSLDFSHPDYPLYYPLLVLWGWLAAGRENAQASIWIALLFTLGVIGVLGGGIREKNQRAAVLAALFLVSTPHFVGMGCSQYADLLISYFFLAAAVVFQLFLASDEPCLAALAGFLAGSSAFVKNEGLLFCGVLIALAMVWTRRRGLGGFLAGAAPFLVATLYFKAAANYPSHMLSLRSWEIVIRSGLFWERTLWVATAFLHEFMKQNSWALAPYFLTALFILKAPSLLQKNTLWLAAVLFLVNLGYLLVYVGTPLDFKTHVETSLNRLMMHSYPMLCYLGFLIYPEIYPERP